MYKFYKNIHLWFAIPFGLVIAATSLSGLILEFMGRQQMHSSFVFRFHRWLMDSPVQKGEMTAGKLIVGISTVAFLFIIVTGLLMWIKRTKGGWRKSLTVKTWGQSLPEVRSIHIAGGVWFSAFLLLMVMTGLTWSFGWWRDVVYGLFSGGEPMGLKGVIYSLHTGSFGGILTKIIWGLSAFVGFTLPVTGYYLFFKRRSLQRRKEREKQMEG